MGDIVRHAMLLLKNFFISSPVLPHEAFYSPDIVTEIAEKFGAMGPFYRLLWDIENYRSGDELLPPKNTVAEFEW